MIVPPAKYKPAVEPVRYLRGVPSENVSSRSARVISFFKGQVKKVGVGTPECFRIDSEEAALQSSTESEVKGREGSAVNAGASSLFPRAGYFNRTSKNGRRGIAFGAGIGQTEPGLYEDSGTPDAKIGFVFGFNF